MKKLLPLIFLLSSIRVFSQTQTCVEVKITDSTLRTIITEYGASCIRAHFFHENIGVIEMVEFQDTTGRKRLLFQALIDDRYKENPTNTYAKVDQYFILVYQADSLGNKKATVASPELLECLSNEIGDRLYIRPVRKERIVEILNNDGTKRKVKLPKFTATGNIWNAVYFIFDSPTNYRIQRPL
jgi:hypothetical protein